MSDHAKADALVDDILHGKAAGGYGKKHKSGRAAQYASGDEHHSDELGLLEDLGARVHAVAGALVREEERPAAAAFRASKSARHAANVSTVTGV